VLQVSLHVRLSRRRIEHGASVFLRAESAGVVQAVHFSMQDRALVLYSSVVTSRHDPVVHVGLYCPVVTALGDEAARDGATRYRRDRGDPFVRADIDQIEQRSQSEEARPMPSSGKRDAQVSVVRLVHARIRLVPPARSRPINQRPPDPGDSAIHRRA